MSALAVPLTGNQIDAACRLHQRLTQWWLSDSALIRLREAVPGFDAESCLLKGIAVNTLYGTQVLAMVRMGNHICDIMARASTESGPELVGQIAALPAGKGETQWRFISFAAKFCHFFVNEERFPIYDEAARDAIKLHLGPGALTNDSANPYQAYCQNLQRLRSVAGVNGPGRDLDRYLWIVGMYMKWLASRQKPKQQINVELRRLFEHPGREAASELDTLLPTILNRAFKGA